MRKAKPLGYKRGDPVIFVSHPGNYGPHLYDGVVTATREVEGLVYVKALNDNGWETKRCYGRETGMFQENPWPMRLLRHKLPGDDVPALKKRLVKADKVRRQYDESVSAMERQLDYDVSQLKRKMYDERLKALPGDRCHVGRVLARMGFPQDKRRK